MKMLKAKLFEMERARVDSARASERKSMVRSGDRSERIRTYKFPARTGDDHRINLTLYKLDRIISGDDLGDIIDAAGDGGSGQPPGRAGIGRVSTERDLAKDEAVCRPGARPNIESSILLDAGASPRCRRCRQSPPRCAGVDGACRNGDNTQFESFHHASRRARAACLHHRPQGVSGGLDFEVGPGVLIPRPETETLSNRRLPSFRNAPRRLRSSIWVQARGACPVAALEGISQCQRLRH